MKIIEIAALIAAGLGLCAVGIPWLQIAGYAIVGVSVLAVLWAFIPWARIFRGIRSVFKRKRIRAAVLFTDIAGYSSLKAQDEAKARELLEKCSYNIKPLIEKHHGTWLKESVDCTISTFKRTIDAVRCAVEIQEKLRVEPDLPVRIGICRGEVLFSGDEVLGHAVSVASGIELFAEPGGICMTDEEYGEVRNELGLKIEPLGERTLKNVDRAVEVYEIKPKKVEREQKPVAVKRTIPSVVVLPFEDISPEKDQEYFCDGMAEEIINALTHVEALRIVARTSAFSFKGTNTDIREIGQKLNVAHVLEGSVRKAGDRLRITAQLINVENGFHLWSERFDRTMEDVFDIQDEISLAIVRELKVRLLNKERQAVEKRYTSSPEAYNIYLKARYHHYKVTDASMKKAVELYNEVLKLDPNFVKVYTDLLSINVMETVWTDTVARPHDVYPPAKEYLRKALTIDDYYAEAHFLAAVTTLWYDWDWDAVFRSLKKACELNPNLDYLDVVRGQILTITGQYDKIPALVKHAQELDPLSSMTNAFNDIIMVSAGYAEQVFDHIVLTIEMDPEFIVNHTCLGWACLALGRFDRAVEAMETAVGISRSPYIMTWLAQACHEAGRHEQAEQVFAELITRSESEYIPPYCFFFMHVAHGDNDRAMEALEQACEERNWVVVFLVTDPWRTFLSGIRDDPRFVALMKRMKLPI